MRLQSAIISVEDALLDCSDPAHVAVREGAEEVLSILKMEGVWMFAVTSLPRAAAQEALRSTGTEALFRGLLSDREQPGLSAGGTIFEKAVRRMQSEKRDTVVFTGRLDLLVRAREAGLRTVAVAGAAGEDEWREMCALATERADRWADFLA